jgi:alpha/beta hydrolase family protein
MRYTLFGRSGLRISELALGAPTFGEDWGWGANREESKKMFDAFTNAGGNFIDTAHVCVHERLKRDADYYASYRPVPESQVLRKATMKARYRVLLSAIFVAVVLLSACEREAAIESITGTATSIDGVTIKYEVAGQGEPALVFVHCWSCNRRFWDDQVAYFAPRYRVVRLDLAGHGGSGRGRGDYTIETFGADAAAVIEQLALKRVILIGHSMGGPVAVEVEKRLGDRVIGVVGVDTFYTGFKAPEGKEAVAALKPLWRTTFRKPPTSSCARCFRPVPTRRWWSASLEPCVQQTKRWL